MLQEKENREYLKNTIIQRYLTEPDRIADKITTAMASKYSDIITIRAGKPAYSIEEEKGDEWQSFIPNEQFNSVLRTVLRSVRGNDIDFHKSFWINGTYGTGKSHAAAVIAHLLCDPVEDIRRWVDYEYQDEKFRIIRESIYSLRESKRLLRVKLESLSNITHVSELAPVVQTAVVQALNENNLEIAVDTDYDSLITHVDENPVIWDDLIARNVALGTVVANRQRLVQLLSQKDAATLQKAKVALREARINVLLEQDSLASWLVEVQEELRRQSDFTGMLIVWDEFTDVMTDSVGVPVLKELQTVAQKFMNEENDSYIFLISHPSAFDKLGQENTKQTDGRYHRMKYNMESVSAFKIMSRKFEILDQERHESMSRLFYTANDDLLTLYTCNSNDPQETRNDLYKLYPLHPGTANLATHYATVVGSSSRSVFEFLGQNPAIREFLDSAEHFAGRDTITAEYLWDFVYNVFQEDVANYGAVTERYNTYRYQVEHEGEEYFAIFKGVLLLNAFNNVASEESVTPSEENIRRIFQGSRYSGDVEKVLGWFNERGIIQRDPSGVYSVQFNALPSHELEEIKGQLTGAEYRFTSQILKYGDTASEYFTKKYAQRVLRPYSFDFYSRDTNDSVLKNRIKNAKKQARPSDLYLALFYARNNEELMHLRNVAEQCSEAYLSGDKDLKEIVYIVIDSTFGDKAYERFIEYMASYKSAGNHGFTDQAEVHRNHAVKMIEEWMKEALRGNAIFYVNGKFESFPINHLSTVLNTKVAPLIFPKGPDSHELLRLKTPATFWKPQVSKEIIRAFIFAGSKSDIDSLKGVMHYVSPFIQDALDDNLAWRSDIPMNHPFKAIFDFVNSTIKNFISHGNTSVPFDFTERFRPLTEPPYGLSGNYASAAAVAFAMRPWIDKIYDKDTGKPRNAESLSTDIQSLFKYWETGKATSRLSFRFQTPQEGKLCKELTRLFRLNKLPDYNDISSIKDARFALIGGYIAKKEYPLWSLKYMSDDFINSLPKLTMNDEVKRLIDNITVICKEKDQKNVALVTSTLELIDRYRADFPDILNKEGSFHNGFVNFLLGRDKVNLKDEEVDDAIDYLRKHLELTIGYWTEEEVSVALLSWRIEKNEEIAERRRREEEEKHRREMDSYADKADKYTGIIGDATMARSKKVDAREMIDNIVDPSLLRGIIDKIIDLGYEQILDIILEEKVKIFGDGPISGDDDMLIDDYIITDDRDV